MDAKEHGQTVLYLKHVSLAGRDIRYFILMDTKEPSKEASKRFSPLFLGADVLSKCGSYALKNLGRLHAKYASEGLATKICFPKNCQIKGIRGTANVAWFYSIHGFFRVAFSYYPREELKVLLVKLNDLWMAYLEEPLLHSELSIHDLEDISLSKDIISLKIDSIKVIESDYGSACCSHSTEQKCDTAAVTCSQQDLVDKGNKVKAQTDSSTPDERHNKEENPPYQRETPETNGIAKNTCSKAYEEKIKIMLSKIFTVFNTEPSLAIITSYIETFVDLLMYENSNIIEKQSTSFPIKLMKDFMDMKNDKEEAGLPEDHELAIHIVSSWVGEKFFMFKDLVKHNVDAFKQAYINAITELPNAEEIIKAVYPSAMFSLVYLWIRGTGENLLNVTEQAEEAKRIGSLYLLILELLNGSPISGLGHLVFSYI